MKFKRLTHIPYQQITPVTVLANLAKYYLVRGGSPTPYVRMLDGFSGTGLHDRAKRELT